MYTKEQAQADYQAELDHARDLLASGQSAVHAVIAGSALAAGRMYVPIDEYIKNWEGGLAVINALPAGTSAEEFNY